LSKGFNRRRTTDTLNIVILIILAISASLIYFYRSAPPEHTVKERTFILRVTVTYENRGADIWNLTEEDYTIWLFGNNSWQTAYLMDHSLPVKSFRTDADGNYIAVLDPQINQLFPNTTWSYDVEYRIITKTRAISDIDERFSLNLTDIPETSREETRKAEGPWQVNDPEIVNLARKIVGNETKVLTMIKKFVKWINSNIRYNTRDIPRYPNETLKERLGDCDDQANLLITFLRIYGVPAYLQMGCIYLPAKKANETSWDGHLTTILSRIGWHGWAMVYVPPWGWLPVDLTYAPGISTDPLNAIKNSAITLQETVQYLNITKTDYISSSVSLRNFLKKHGFCIYEYDEMGEESATTLLLERTRLFTNACILAWSFKAYKLNHGEDL